MVVARRVRRGDASGIASLACALSLLAAPSLAGAEPTGRDAAAWMDEAYRLKARGDAQGAALALESARSAGYDPQTVAMELGYVALLRQDGARARAEFEAAARGPDPEISARARAELVEAWLSEATARRERGRAGAAEEALSRAALLAPGSPRVELERGYAAAARGDVERARIHFRTAAEGEGTIPAQARAELHAMRPPSAFRVDLYGETFAWRRFRGDGERQDAVPTLRVRALRRLFEDVPLDLFAFAQGTRDLASRPATAHSGPVLLADNAALAGGGLLLRPAPFLGVFAKLAAAAPLVDAGGGVKLDARAGAYLAVESSRCAPAHRGTRLVLAPCGEVYSEATWLGRFRDDVVGVARGRASVAWLATGPVAWQFVTEVRAGADRNRDYWDNFADGGVGHRWRLVRPFRADLLVSCNAGRYLGLSGRDPLPAKLGYAELRAELSVSLEP